MRISSYHKQCGDQVTFVLNEFDIRRPYDLYYIIKEKSSTPNPPFDFYKQSEVDINQNERKIMPIEIRFLYQYIDIIFGARRQEDENISWIGG